MAVMTTTHAAMGLLVAIGVVETIPELATPIAVVAYAGSAFPDLDIVVGDHRRTLHYPVGYWALTMVGVGVYVWVPTTVTLSLAVFLGGAALHSSTDVFGGGLAPKPWIEDDERGVYDHLRDRWISPRRVIRWDGAPEDLVVAVLMSVPAILYFDWVVDVIAITGLVASVLYTGLRRRLPDIIPGLFR